MRQLTFALERSPTFATWILLVCSLLESVSGASWNASSDYSNTSNPNGVWSYGRKSIVNGQGFDVMTVRWGDSGWYLGNAGHGGPSIQSGPLLWAKDNSNGKPAVRWRCSTTGTYRIEGRFTGADSRGVDSRVYVVMGGTNAFSGRVRANQQAVPFVIESVRIDAGATIDFVLEWGGDVNSEYSWTDLDATISDSAVEPPSEPPTTPLTTCATKPAGLIAWWPGDGFAFDVSGTNHVIFVNAAAFSEGKSGQAFHLSGSNYLSIPHSSTFSSLTGAMSFETWFKVNRWDKTLQCIVSKGRSWAVQRNWNSRSLLFSSEGLSNSDLVGSRSVDDGQWHHVACVYDGAKKYLYVDGVLDASVAAAGLNLINTGPVLIGENPYYTGRIYNGSIDEVSIYNRALSANEILAIFAAGSAGKCFTNSPAPVFVQQPADQNGYAGGSVTFSAAAMGTPRPSYQWHFNGTPIVAATNASLTLDGLSPANAGFYTLRAANDAGSLSSAVATLAVRNISTSYTYHRTTNFFQPHADWSRAVKAEFGPSAEVVDWNTIKARFGGSVPVLRSLFETVGIVAPLRDEGVAVTWNGTQTWSGDRSYGVNRADGSVPGGYLVHDQILGNWALLGSWPENRRILARVPAPPGQAILPNPEPFESGWGNWDSDNHALWQIGVPQSGPPLTPPAGTSVIFQESFESGATGPGISVQRVGSFGSTPGVKNQAGFGSTRAFGFGRSTCAASCFDSFASTLTIRLTNPTYVSGIAFSEMELSGNWGSGGQVIADGVVVPNSSFGREPYNDFTADTSFRQRQFPIGRVVTNLVLRVADITRDSEIFIDDLIVYAGSDLSRAHSPPNVASTLLSGNYAANSQGRLISPSFPVPPVTADGLVVARFWQWYQYGTGDGGQVQASVWNGTAWSEWNTIAVAATNGITANWVQTAVDMSAFQGQFVRLGFLHTANSDASVGKGWMIDDLSVSDFIPTTVTLGASGVFNFTNNQYQYFALDVPPGGHLRVRLTSANGQSLNELYLRRGSLPTSGSFDARFTTNGANQSVLVPDAGAGKWYVLALNAANPGAFTLETEYLTDTILDHITPKTMANGGFGTISVNGAGFEDNARAFLVSPGRTIEATNIDFLSTSRLVADFFLLGEPTNTYSLQVVVGTNSATLTNALTLISAGEPRLVTRLVTPSQVGPGAPATIIVEYANEGTAAMPAPLLVLTGTDGARMSMQAARLIRGFWTSAQPIGFSETVQLLGSGTTPGLLQPGERFRVPVQFIGLSAPEGFTVRFDLGVVSQNSTLPNPNVPWATLKTQMRPVSIPADAWDPIWNNFVSATGPLWTDYVRMLNANAAYLARLGLTVTDVNDLLAFALAQADGMNIVRSLASSTDAAVPAPGLNLSFGRFFPQNLSGRYRLGPLGRGWAHNWETALSEAADGTATITGPGGSRRVFQPDRRTSGSTFFSDIGDHGTLTKSGGSFTLAESRGLKRVFAADGKLTYAEDPNGNRITTTFSGNLLTKLTHSSGQSLTLNYSGGLLQSVTDSNGRATAYSYDAGQHLQAAAYFDGTTVTYSYATGLGAAREHALTQVAYPGGTHEYFSYDANGRLATMQRDGGAEAITFGYEGAGLVSVTDVFTNKSRFYLNHRGLMAKMENPLRQTLRFTYDGEFNLTSLTDPAGRSHEYAYDTNGNLSETTDPLGGRTRFLYGALNRLATLTDAKGNLTRYAHDAKGNLNAIIYANNSVERWGYDATGNPTTWTNRRANAIGYQFNTNGQLTAKNYPDGSRAIYGYDARGNLTLASNYVGAITLDYYTTDRLRRITYPGNRWLEYTYDPAGRRTSMTDQLGYRQDYLYDSAGRLQSLTNATGELVRYGYDVAGRLLLKTLGNGVFTTYHYDSAGQLLALTNRQPNSNVLSFFKYTYDPRGRRTAMQTHYGAWTYGYDDLGQLTRAVLASTSTNVPSQDLTYVYDALGNRIRTIENGVTTLYTANNLNQYTQVGGLTLNYDADGSLTQKLASATTVLAMTNSFENRVTGFGSTSGTRRFDYDALGLASAIWRDGVQSIQVHDPFGLGDLVGDYDNGGNLVERQTHGFGTVGTAIAATQSFLTFDAMGNVSDSTDAGGTLVGSQVFGPFGERIQPTVGTAHRLGFSGEFGVTREDDLSFVRARFFDSKFGRFTATDPIGLMGGDVNLYRYVANNPNSFVDPKGEVLVFLANPVVLRWIVWPVIVNYGLMNILPIFKYGQPVESETLPYEMYPGPYENPGYTPPSIPDQTPHPGPGDGPPGIPEPFEIPDRNPFQPPEGFPPGNGGNFPGGNSNPNWPIVPPTDPNGPGDSSEIPNGRPRDPNEKTGPAGFGTNHNYLAASSLFAYRIDFENATNAPAPAQVVLISDPLTNTLDWSTLELTEIAFGDRFLTVPPGSQRFARTEHVSYLGVNFDVKIEVGLNPATGVLTARFDSLNPLTGLPPSGTSVIGFLPPENGTGRGKGHVSFTIRPKPSLPTGTEIRNVAFITFDPDVPGSPIFRTDLSVLTDPNSPPSTNRQALVTIDADLPTSNVVALPAEALGALFQVCWSGTDTGSGITGYDVYVRANSGPWTLWLANTAATCETFPGKNLTAYSFYTVARDGSGNIEAPPSVPDASTLAPANSTPVLDAISHRVIRVNETLSVTNLASDPDLPAQHLTFSLDAGSPTGARIDPGTGVLRWTPSCPQGSTVNTFTVRVTDNGTPPKSISQSFTVTVLECVEASLGETVIAVGEAGSVPVQLLSTVELTNLVFSVAYPADRFTGFTLAVDLQQVSQPVLEEKTPGRLDIQLTLPGERILHGPTNVGTLHFLTRSNQSSVFAPLPILDIDGLKPNGNQVANAYGQPGRVVVVGSQALLESRLNADQSVVLILYGPPRTTNQILTADRMSGEAFQLTGSEIVLTNLFQLRQLGIPTNGMMFYRSQQR